MFGVKDANRRVLEAKAALKEGTDALRQANETNRELLRINGSLMAEVERLRAELMVARYG